MREEVQLETHIWCLFRVDVLRRTSPSGYTSPSTEERDTGEGGPQLAAPQDRTATRRAVSIVQTEMVPV
jgi:hypothetical protein